MENKPERSTTDRDVVHFNRWAPTYDQSLMQRWLFGPVHAKMIELLKREGLKNQQLTIIDVGCGTGRLLRDISTQWQQTQLFGVDPAEEMLVEAQRHNPEAAFLLAPAESLPFPDQFADVVLSSISFHHWVDHQRGVQEISRVLRLGGLFCLADIIFLPARLSGDKVINRHQIRALMTGAGLVIRLHKRMWARFVLITLAQKPLNIIS